MCRDLACVLQTQQESVSTGTMFVNVHCEENTGKNWVYRDRSITMNIIAYEMN